MKIISIRFKGLRRFLEKNDPSGLPQERLERIRRILTALTGAANMEQADTIGMVHPLKGNRAGTYAIAVSGNWRLTFLLKDNEIFDRRPGGLSLMTDGPLSTGMMPSHPGAIVREEILAPLSLTVSKAAKALGVRRATVSDLLNEKAALSPEMALRIELAFGVSMEMMLRIQTSWDIATTRQREPALHVVRYQPEERAS